MTTATRALTLVTLLAAGCARVPPAPPPAPPAVTEEERPRHSFYLTCYQGKVNSGVYATSNIYQTKDIYHRTSSFKFGPSAGPMAEVGFRFLRHDGDRDVIEFTLRHPADDPNATTQRRDLAYRDEALTLFETATHTVTVGPTTMPVP